MVSNSMKLDMLEDNQELFLVRYSQAEHPDYTIVNFKGFNKDTRQIDYVIKDKIKRINITKAQYRLFLDRDEMARALYDCFMKRDLEPISEYKELFETSQDVRPELWI